MTVKVKNGIVISSTEARHAVGSSYDVNGVDGAPAVAKATKSSSSGSGNIITPPKPIVGYNAAGEPIYGGPGTLFPNAPALVASQNGVMQSTSPTNNKDKTTKAKVDSKVQQTFNSNKPVVGYNAAGEPIYGGPGTLYPDGKASVADPSNGLNTGKPAGAAGTQNPQDPNNQNNSINDSKLVAPDGTKLSATAPSGFEYSLPTPADGGSYLYSQDGHVYTQDSKGGIALDPTGEQEYQKNKKFNDRQQQRDKIYDDAKAGLDSAHQALIDSIKEQAAIQTQQMEELNKRTLAVKAVQQYRSGAAEYTPEIATGIMKAEEEEGLARLSDIDSKMKLTLAQAVSANNKEDFDLAKQKMDEVDKLSDDKETAVQNIYKNYMDNAKYIADTLKAQQTEDRANQDQALQELTTAAPNLVENYDKLKSQADKDAYLAAISKKTGLDSSIILGEMSKNRLATQNTKSEIANRNKTTQQSQKNYDEKSIPSDIKKQILDDIKGVKDLTLNQLYDAYPEVDTTYLEKLFNSLGSVQ